MKVLKVNLNKLHSKRRKLIKTYKKLKNSEFKLAARSMQTKNSTLAKKILPSHRFLRETEKLYVSKTIFFFLET